MLRGARAVSGLGSGGREGALVREEFGEGSAGSVALRDAPEGVLGLDQRQSRRRGRGWHSLMWSGGRSSARSALNTWRK